MDNVKRYQKDLEKLTQYSFELEHRLESLNQEIIYHKEQDQLTEVLNKDTLLSLLKDEKNRLFMLLNIDNFSNINSAYGYDIGDLTLIEVAKSLNVVKPRGFKLYRYYADKFVLVGTEKKQVTEIETIAESILSFFNASDLSIDDEMPIPISFSIGISSAKGLSAILQAELALKEIRKSRRNFYYIYDQKLENLELQQESVYWINKIRESILEDEIVVHFQPILNNYTNKIEKYECLARIDDEGTFVSPFSFMYAASATKVLHLMTRSVIEQAFQKFENTEYEFSINITKDDLFINYLNDFLLKNCKKFNIKPAQVVIEILEDITSINEKDILDQLHLFRKNGFQIAIDDFGAEHSNFSRLLEFKPDYLKIDGAFIKNIKDDVNSRIITETITGLCKRSGIKVIAEYIHNKDVLNIIQEMEIDYSQGFYIGEPSIHLV